VTKMKLELSIHEDGAISIYMDDTNVLFVFKDLGQLGYSDKEWQMFDTTTDEEMCEDLDGSVDEIAALAVRRVVKWYMADGGATWRARNGLDIDPERT